MVCSMLVERQTNVIYISHCNALKMIETKNRIREALSKQNIVKDYNNGMCGTYRSW